MKLNCFFAILIIFGLLSLNCKTNNEKHSKIEKIQIKISYSHQADFSSELHTTAWLFKQYLEDKSDALQVKLYASNMLGQERDVYEAMQLGAGATGVISGTAILNHFLPRIGVLDLSFLWDDYGHVHRVLDNNVGQIFESELEQKGIKVLVWLDSWGYRNVATSSQKIDQPSDLNGLKIRTIQTPINIAALNAMGANATPMAFGEVYTSLQTGVLDGFEHNATVIKANKFYEVAKHLTLTRHLFGPLVFCYSKKKWDELSPEHQALIQEAAIFARDIQRSLAPLKEKEALMFLEDNGMVIQSIDRKPLIKTAYSLQNKLAKEIGAFEILEQIRNLKNDDGES